MEMMHDAVAKVGGENLVRLIGPSVMKQPARCATETAATRGIGAITPTIPSKLCKSCTPRYEPAALLGAVGFPNSDFPSRPEGP